MKSEAQFSISKADLRAEYKKKRRALRAEDKAERDFCLVENLLSSELYNQAEMILCYASMPDEICTDSLISRAINDGKRVAVPYCRDKQGNMDFYYINSLDELRTGSYGIREPSPETADIVDDFSKCLIVLPALSYTDNGDRLGYGGGYYDRFLQKHPLNSVGLCYNDFIADLIPTDKYDCRVDNIITDSRIIKCGNGGKNG